MMRISNSLLSASIAAAIAGSSGPSYVKLKIGRRGVELNLLKGDREDDNQRENLPKLDFLETFFFDFGIDTFSFYDALLNPECRCSFSTIVEDCWNQKKNERGENNLLQRTALVCFFCCVVCVVFWILWRVCFVCAAKKKQEKRNDVSVYSVKNEKV